MLSEFELSNRRGSRLLIICVYPLLLTGCVRNPVSFNQVRLLQASNVLANTTEDCEYLKSSVLAWFKSSSVVLVDFDLIDEQNGSIHVQWAQLLPVRCAWQREDGVITSCRSKYAAVDSASLCKYWNETVTQSPEDASAQYFADRLGVRLIGIVEVVNRQIGPANFSGGAVETEFFVRAIYNETHTIALTYVTSFQIQLLFSSTCT
jgi:hypothetical protein